MQVGDKVKYSQTWLSSTQIKRAKWRGTVAALYMDKDAPSDTFVYVRWEGDTEDRLVNRHNLTKLKSKKEDIMKKAEVMTKPEVIIPNLKPLTLSQIAKLIMRDWGAVNYAAKPYLQAMNELKDVNDKFGYDSGASVVRYFLSNASSYRGDLARAIKTELRLRVKDK
jgi:hypothetical protein